jgi:high-affinity iron transporter
VRRLALILISLTAVAAVGAGTARAGDNAQFKDVRVKVAQARAIVDQAVAAARRGDRERAYELARDAYLNHFELAEVPLRLRDPNLVLDLEFRFAKLRNGIREGATVGEIRTSAIAVKEGLQDVDKTLADKGIAAPLIAFVFSFTILFREGVEAVLIVAILLGALEAGRAADYRRPLAGGVLAAVVASIATWLLTALVIDIAPLQRELLEAITALVSVAILFTISFWLVAQLERRHWMEFMRARVSTAIGAGTAVAFAGLGFTAVYREGFETALFYQALLLFAQGLEVWVVAGAAVATVALGVVAYAILKLGKRLPVKPMLMSAVAVLVLLSVAFVGNAVRSLQVGDWIGVTPIDSGWARLPIYVAELTGIHPTREGITAQAALLTVYVVGAVYVFLVRPARRSRAGATARA